MQHLYAGSGVVSNNTGTNMPIQITATISDQLVTWQGQQPVPITPGQQLPSNQYSWVVGPWYIAVAGLGSFFGSAGRLYLELAINNTISDLQWYFDSDAGADYSWGGGISDIDKPTTTDWPNPMSRAFAQLPRKIQLGMAPSPGMGQAISPLFTFGGSNMNLDVTLTRL